VKTGDNGIMRLPDDLHDLLKASGLNWRIEDGGEHFKLMVSDQFVAILPKGSRADLGSGHLSLVAQVRRAIRKLARANNVTIFSGG